MKDAAKWTSSAPSILREAVIGGVSEVTLPKGKFQAAMLLLGTDNRDRTLVQVNGATF